MWWRANELIFARMPFFSASSPRYAPHFHAMTAVRTGLFGA